MHELMSNSWLQAIVVALDDKEMEPVSTLGLYTPTMVQYKDVF